MQNNISTLFQSYVLDSFSYSLRAVFISFIVITIYENSRRGLCLRILPVANSIVKKYFRKKHIFFTLKCLETNVGGIVASSLCENIFQIRSIFKIVLNVTAENCNVALLYYILFIGKFHINLQYILVHTYKYI